MGFQTMFGDNYWKQFATYFQKGLTQLNIYEGTNEMLYVFSLPGIEEMSDIAISVQDSSLKVNGKVCLQYEQFQLKEEGIMTGNFTREVTLPYPVDKKTVRSYYKNGLLHVLVHRQLPSNENESTIIVERTSD